MRRIKLTVAYDGTAYSGWQLQNNALSVQEVLETALRSLTGSPVRVSGASRTDAGVHARGNVAVFDTEMRMPADRFAFALNTWLPPDIRILNSMEVSPAFHPRFTDTIKTYEYRIMNRPISDPLQRLYAMHCYGTLDTDAMRQAALALQGTHDFRSFEASGSQKEGHSTVRTIYSTSLERDGDLIRFRITGNGFLYHMVRIIAGTLLEIGRGDRDADDMAALLEAADRSAAGATAPACGLILEEIRYPSWEPDFLAQRERDSL